MRTTITKPVEVTEVTCDWCGVFILEERQNVMYVGGTYFSMGPYEFHNEACYKAAVAAFTVLLAETRKGVGT